MAEGKCGEGASPIVAPGGWPGLGPHVGWATSGLSCPLTPLTVTTTPATAHSTTRSVNVIGLFLFAERIIAKQPIYLLNTKIAWHPGSPESLVLCHIFTV